MPRRRVVAKREVLPDPKYGNVTLAKFMNHVMVSGKKSVAETIVYGALDIVHDKLNKDPLEAFDEALENIAPMVEVKARRVGGATYQVPVEVRPARRIALSMRWLVEYARNRGEKSMRQRLADLNPQASMRMANRLLEASDRDYWTPDSDTLEALQNAADAIEDRLEGIAAE